MKVFWTKLALRDLHHVWNYIAADNPRAAEDMMVCFRQAVDSLLSYPKMGRPGRVKGTRELVIVGSAYLIPYRVKKKRQKALALDELTAKK